MPGRKLRIVDVSSRDNNDGALKLCHRMISTKENVPLWIKPFTVISENRSQYLVVAFQVDCADWFRQARGSIAQLLKVISVGRPPVRLVAIAIGVSTFVIKSS